MTSIKTKAGWMFLISLISFALYFHPFSRGRAASSPLIIQVSESETFPPDYFSASNLWSWSEQENKFQKLSNLLVSGPISLSPLGNLIALRNLDQIDSEDKENGTQCCSGSPTDIAILDISSNQVSFLADQPSGARYSLTRADSLSNYYIIRSVPVWSPNGQSLAWTEIVVNGERSILNPNKEDHRLVVYDLSKRTTKILLDGIPPQRTSMPATPFWGTSGILLLSEDLNLGTNGRASLDDTVSIYNTQALLQSTVKIRSLDELVWISNSNGDYVAALTECPDNVCSKTVWMIIDPKSGSMTGLVGVLELRSEMTNGLSIMPSSTIDTIPNWEIFRSNRSAMPVGHIGKFGGYGLPFAAAISPDGQSAAYIDEKGTLHIYNGTKTLTPISPGFVTTLVWGVTEWKIYQDYSVLEF